MIAAGDFDTSGTARESTSILTVLSLKPVESAGQPPNPTGWRIVDGFANTGKDGEVFEDNVMLDASLDDFASLLTMACEGAIE